ncbi:MAG: hypothetical protein B6I26_06150 [Desulfobacteraceae bacterium 4572_130]|nr:MAG: hypothetical protein B6I26_06150 [Desulfobacteraceae bacterium 4572_130]
MATINVACPYCGKQTWVTAPTWTDDNGRLREKSIYRVVQNPSYKKIFKTTIHVALPKRT